MSAPGSDYGVTVTVPNITEVSGFIASRVTFWGVPGDPWHDSVRGWNCINPQEHAPPAFHRAAIAAAAADAPDGVHRAGADECRNRLLAERGHLRPRRSATPSKTTSVARLGWTDCNQLPFTPSIRATPDGQAGSTPTGLTVDEHVPQEST